jgi:hypothetical protein
MIKRSTAGVLGLVLLAAAVSMTELAATHLFSLLILPTEAPRSTGNIAFLVGAFFALYGGLRLIHFFREMYRIHVFERALSESEGLTPARDSWRWSLAMEVTGVLSAAGRLVVVVLVCLVISPLFGLAALLAAAATAKILSGMITRQLGTQREFRAMQLARSPAPNATRVRSRIRAAEVGSLVVQLSTVVLIGWLLVLTFMGFVSPVNAFVSFVALRQMSQVLTEICKGLMRYVRSRALTE